MAQISLMLRVSRILLKQFDLRVTRGKRGGEEGGGGM